MKLIRKHLIGIICFIIAMLYVLIIALNIKETKKENKEDLSKYKVLCTEILKQEDTDEEKKEWCTEILNTEYEIEDTLSITHDFIDSATFNIYILITPIIIMIISTLNANKNFRSLNIKNYLNRESYTKYLKRIFKSSYIYTLFLPLIMIVIFICSYLISGHFDYNYAVNSGYSTYNIEYLKQPILFMTCVIANLFFMGIFYINIALVYIRSNKNYIVSMIESSITYYFLYFVYVYVIAGILLKKIKNADSYFNFVDMYSYHDVTWITLFTFLCFLTAVISSIIVYLIYKNKEKTLIKLEQCGGNI